MHGALEEGRLGGENVLDRRGHVIVQVAAEIIELAVVARARRKGRLLQADAALLVDRDHAAVEPLVEHGAGAHVARHGFDQVLVGRSVAGIGDPAQPQRRAGGVGEFGRGDPARDDHARARDAGGNEPDRRPRPAQTTHLLAVNAGEQADPAVRLLLAAEGEVVFRDVDVELAQKVGERGKRQPRADEQPDERPQQARNRRLQARGVRRLGRVGHRAHPIAADRGIKSHKTVVRRLTWEFFPRTAGAPQRSGISFHG